jgi:hypothetical protein
MRRNFKTRSDKKYINPLFTKDSRVPFVISFPKTSIFILIIVLGGIFYCLYGLPFWKLKKLEIQGTYTFSVDMVKEITLNQMQARWLLFFHQDGLWGFDTAAYQQRLKEHWLFSNLKVKKILPNTLRLEVTEEAPAFIIRTIDAAYGVNSQGILSAKLDSINSLSAPEILFQDPQPQLKLNEASISKNDAIFLTSFIKKIQNQFNSKIVIQSIQLANAPDRTATLLVKGDWSIIVDRSGNYESQAQAFILAYEQKLQGKKLEYVNVTVPDRIYYK